MICQFTTNARFVTVHAYSITAKQEVKIIKMICRGDLLRLLKSDDSAFQHGFKWKSMIPVKALICDIIWSKNDEYNNTVNTCQAGLVNVMIKVKVKVMMHSQQLLTTGISSHWHTCNSLLSTFSNLSKRLSSLQNKRMNDKLIIWE